MKKKPVWKLIENHLNDAQLIDTSKSGDVTVLGIITSDGIEIILGRLKK
ncbi:hypothetical protein [Parabacteroides pacaensis]|nr:hypothetical protein [Parabacteroides pacaensis]